MTAKAIRQKIANAWTTGHYTAVYADGSTRKVLLPCQASTDGLIAVYTGDIALQHIREDFLEAGLVIE